jgi:hypothetical protein
MEKLSQESSRIPEWSDFVANSLDQWPEAIVFIVSELHFSDCKIKILTFITQSSVASDWRAWTLEADYLV